MPQRIFRVGRAMTGLGLFATRIIEREAYIATYRGRRISNAEAEAREQRNARYLFELNSKWTIDGSSRWNVARYANHSCRPNAEAIGRKGKIVLVARRRIKPGEEITYDYGKDYFKAFITKAGCRCVKCREQRTERRRAARKTLATPRKAKSKAARSARSRASS
jgi:uncharacterized protein